MKIEIWSDYACPFCYIGKLHLQAALVKMNLIDKTEIIMRSFELDEGAPKAYNLSFEEGIAKKYGCSAKSAKEGCENIVNMAKAAGADFNIESVVLTNTFDAHRLTHLALDEKPTSKLSELIFISYFEKGEDISQAETLVKIGKEAGIDEEKVREVFSSDKYSQQVRNEEAKAKAMGVDSVPYFLFDEKYYLCGAQPIDVFVKVLELLLSEQQGEHSNVLENAPEEPHSQASQDCCDENGCR